MEQRHRAASFSCSSAPSASLGMERGRGGCAPLSARGGGAWGSGGSLVGDGPTGVADGGLTILLLFQVKLVNIRNDDITDGNPKLTLGLIWTIILHFQVGRECFLLEDVGPMGGRAVSPGPWCLSVRTRDVCPDTRVSWRCLHTDQGGGLMYMAASQRPVLENSSSLFSSFP